MKPIFIIGNARSGTTLTRFVINAHQNILIPPEAGFAIWLYEKYKDWEVQYLYSKLDQYLEDLFKVKKFDTWELEKESLKTFLLKKKPENYHDLTSEIYSFYGLYHGICFRRWGDKNNFYLNHISEIKQLFPEALLIYVIRDGRDVACSYRNLRKKEINSKYKPNLPYEIEDIAEDWKKNNNTILESLKNVSEEDFLIVKYEDIVRKTDETARKICHFFQEPFDEGMVQYYDSKRSREPEEFLQWKEKIYKKPDESSIGRYNKELSEDQINVFNSICNDLLTYFNYL